MPDLSPDHRHESTGSAIPARDWIVLPLICLGTLVAMGACTEIGARLLWPEKKDNRCLYTDQAGWQRHKPGCMDSMKNAEGEWVEYRYNACGYRGAGDCRSKLPGTVRLVTIGSSFSEGMYVAEKDLFLNQAAGRLSGILGHKVDFQNLGKVGPPLTEIAKLSDEILSTNPDGVFLMLLPWDLRRLDPVVPTPARGEPTEFLWAHLEAAARLSSRALFMVQHLRLSEEDFVVKSFAMYMAPDDFSRTPPPVIAALRFRRLTEAITPLAARLAGKGVPLFIIGMPDISGAAVLHSGSELPGVDAAAFTRGLEKVAAASGARFIDVIPEIRKAPQITNTYFPVDGHPSGVAHALIANSVVRYFAQRGVAELSSPTPADRATGHVARAGESGTAEGR